MKHGMIEDSDGDREWYCNDKRHRTDGPAIERASGDREWWYHGEEYTLTQWLKLAQENLTQQQTTALIVNYSEKCHVQ